MRRLTVGGITLVAALGCDGDPTVPPSEMLLIAVHAGDAQSAPAGGRLALPLEVSVRDPAGALVRGARVVFRAWEGSEVQLTDTIVTSGFDGVARVSARLGPRIGSGTIATAYSPGRPSDAVSFAATATPPPTLDGIAPVVVAGGDTVMVSGTNLHEDPAGNAVFFGSARGRILGSPAPGALRVVVPPCVTPGPVAVYVAVGSVNTATRSITYSATAPRSALDPLQAITVEAGALDACLRLTGDGASYLVVPHFPTAPTALEQIEYLLGDGAAGQGGLAAFAAPAPNGRDTMQAGFDRALREAEHLLSASGPSEISPSVAVDIAAQSLEVNSTRAFRVLSTLAPNRPTFTSVTARLKYAGSNVLVYVDVASPPGYSDEQLTRFGALFDVDLFPIAVRAFGAESDIDDNGRVIVLMTPVVNALTPKPCGEGYVAGFFYGYDLVSRSSNSNRGEVFYSAVPDPSGQFSCEHSVAQIQGVTPTTFVHELQHMISFNQHVLVRRGDDEALWLNEGLSHVAEELAARRYEERYPPPSGRTRPTQLFPDSAAPFINGNLVNSYTFLRARATNSVTVYRGAGSLEERGATWLFLRWLADQKGDAIFGALVQTAKTGVANVEEKSGESFAGLFADFALAVYADSIPGVVRGAVSPRNRFVSRNLRQLYRALYDAVQQPSALVPSPFPIEPKPLAYNQAVTDRMLPGTMDFFRLETPRPGGAVALRFARPNGSPFDVSQRAQLGVFRLP